MFDYSDFEEDKNVSRAVKDTLAKYPARKSLSDEDVSVLNAAGNGSFKSTASLMKESDDDNDSGLKTL